MRDRVEQKAAMDLIKTMNEFESFLFERMLSIQGVCCIITPRSEKVMQRRSSLISRIRLSLIRVKRHLVKNKLSSWNLPTALHQLLSKLDSLQYGSKMGFVQQLAPGK